MKLACLHAGRLLERRGSGLSSAEGLTLEEHLAGCTTCRADANLLHGLARLSAQTRASLSETGRQRAIARALAAGTEPRKRLSPQRARRGGLLLTAAVAASVCAWVVTREYRSVSPAPVASSQPASRSEAPPSDHVLSGQIEVAGSALGTGELVRDRVQWRTANGASLALAHARVELRADSEASWDAQARSLNLVHGSALFDVDPTLHQSFEVQTSKLIVMVLGTRFEVTESSVRVLRGRVSVKPKASPQDEAPLLLAADSERSAFELPPPAADKPEPAKRHSAGELLERARAQLAGRQLAQARKTLRLAGPLLQDDAERAQALSLKAECEQQAHRFNRARDGYLRVAHRFPGLPAAETALFAAARIEADHGQAARAKELLSDYLAKYPHGSFTREAALRLRRLDTDPQP